MRETTRNINFSRMAARSKDERDAWVNTIQESIKEHPFYDIITTKKAAQFRKSMNYSKKYSDHNNIPNYDPILT